MVNVADRQTRRRVTVAGAGCWAAAVACAVAEVVYEGHASDVAHMANLLLVSVAALLTGVSLLSRTIAPVEAAYRLGYQAGVQDGITATEAGKVVRMPVGEEASGR